MLEAPHVDVKTCKNAVRATHLANGRFLYRNPCQTAAGKWVGIYYGEIRVPHKFANLANFCEGGRLDGCKSVPNCCTRGREQAAGKRGAERRQEGIGRRENRWELGDEGGRRKECGERGEGSEDKEEKGGGKGGKRAEGGGRRENGKTEKSEEEGDSRSKQGGGRGEK